MIQQLHNLLVFIKQPASGYQFAYPYRNDFLNGPPMSGSYYVVLPDGRIQVIYY